METAVYTTAQLRNWEAFHAASVQGTVFTSLPWLQLLGEQTHADPAFLVTTEGDALHAAIPLMRKKKLWYSVSTSNPLAPYSGLLLAGKGLKEAHAQDVLSGILKTGLTEFGFVALSLHPSVQDMRPFLWASWGVHPMYTYWVDIGNEDMCWTNFSQSLRRKLRRADDDGISVRENNNPDLLVKQYAHSYHRHGIAEPIPLDTMRRWIDALCAAGMGTMFTAFTANGEPLASRLVIPDSPFVYDFVAGSSKEGDAHSANHALVAGIMKHYARLCYTTFDFRGANTPGVIDFKRSFGGALVSYYQTELRNAALLSFAERIRATITAQKRGL